MMLLQSSADELARVPTLQVRRETDASRINRVSNDAAVRPFVCYHDEEMDWSTAVQNCVVLSYGDDAIGVFEETKPRLFQAHTIFGRGCRGAAALEAAGAMIAWMIPRHADAIWGATPVSNAAARWFNRRLGARSIGFDQYAAEGAVEIFILGSIH